MKTANDLTDVSLPCLVKREVAAALVGAGACFIAALAVAAAIGVAAVFAYRAWQWVGALAVIAVLLGIGSAGLALVARAEQRRIRELREERERRRQHGAQAARASALPTESIGDTVATWLPVGTAALAILGPRRALRLAAKAFTVWQTYRRLRDSVSPPAPRGNT